MTKRIVVMTREELEMLINSDTAIAFDDLESLHLREELKSMGIGPIIGRLDQNCKLLHLEISLWIGTSSVARLISAKY
jgi:hypothetical protein